MNNRREIIFIYDVKDANPNGDPDDGNRPRMDSEGYNIVTDVRLKRTIRDYWLANKDVVGGKDVLVKRVEQTSGELKSMGELIKTALGIGDVSKSSAGETVERIRKEVPETFIDVKFFGAAITLKGANVSLTGPVQFGIGRSLNKPTIRSLTITTTFAAGEGRTAGTFGETVGVDYSLICFPGVVAENTAKIMGLSDEDLPALWKGLWYGTKNLNTRSKFNHSPRLLAVIVSKEKEFQIGGLNRLLKAHSYREDGKILSEQDVWIKVDDLLARLEQFKDSILKIELLEDPIIKYSEDGQSFRSLEEILKEHGFIIEKLSI